MTLDSPLRILPWIALCALAIAPAAAATTAGACNDSTGGGAKDCYGVLVDECAGNGLTVGVGHYGFVPFVGPTKPSCYVSASPFDSDPDGTAYTGVCFEYPEPVSSDTYAYCEGVVRDSTGGYCVGGWNWDRTTDARSPHTCLTIVVHPIRIIFTPPLLA